MSDFVLFNVSLGTPPQTLEVFVETVDPIVWIFAAEFDRTSERIPFDHERSSTAEFVGNFTDNEVLDDLAAEGRLFVDELKVGSSSFRQQFGVVDRLYDHAPANYSFPFAGKLGLGWLENEAANPLVPANSTAIRPLLADFPSEEQVYTIWLGSRSNGDPSARLTFGGVDDEKCASESLLFVPFVDVASIFPAYKTFQIDRFSYLDQAVSEPSSAFFALGYAGVQLAPAFYDLVQRALSPEFDWTSGFLTLDCATVGELGDLRFEIGGQEFAIPPREFVLDVGLADDRCVLATSKREVIHSADQPPTILGNPFARGGNCVVFDVANNRIGFTTAVSQE